MKPPTCAQWLDEFLHLWASGLSTSVANWHIGSYLEKIFKTPWNKQINWLDIFDCCCTDLIFIWESIMNTFVVFFFCIKIKRVHLRGDKTGGWEACCWSCRGIFCQLAASQPIAGGIRFSGPSGWASFASMQFGMFADDHQAWNLVMCYMCRHLHVKTFWHQNLTEVCQTNIDAAMFTACKVGFMFENVSTAFSYWFGYDSCFYCWLFLCRFLNVPLECLSKHKGVMQIL